MQGMKMLILMFSVSWGLTDALSSNSKHITETLLDSMKKFDELEKMTKLHDVQNVDGKAILRGFGGEGSVVHLKKETNLSSWAVEMTINMLEIKDAGKASLMLWYTANEFDGGNFYGGPERYAGLMAGIEVSRKRMDLLLDYNSGRRVSDPANTQHRDHVNPDVLVGVKELTIKVVHTLGNFLIELYSEGKLISDTFRINRQVFAAGEEKEMFFIITTSYTGIPKEKAFELKNAAIYKREEDEEYLVDEHHTDHNKFPRNKNDDEVKATVASLLHHMAYIHLVLGGEEKNNISNMGGRLKELIKKQKDELEVMTKSIKALNNSEGLAFVQVQERKLNDLNFRVAEISTKLNSLADLIGNDPHDKKMPMKEISNIIIVFAILTTLILLTKQIVWRYLIFGIAPKKE